MNEPQTKDHQKAGSGRAPSDRKHRFVAVSLLALVAGMVGMSYAAVPLYQMFCQVTGYGGTTQRADSAPTKVLDKHVTVRFDANTSRELPWKFHPVQQTVDVKIGESVLVFYEAHNSSSERLTGTATFNVTPEAAGVYFNKIQCFCFTEQVLEPGETVQMPVTFFIDPEFATDPDTQNVDELTLSYTFFLKKNPTGSVAKKPSAQEEDSKQGS